MALTSTEENQLRELLRRMNATQPGKTANQLPMASSTQTIGPYIAKQFSGNGLTTVPRHIMVADLIAIEPPVNSINGSAASGSLNHLMTRDATRSEIARLTDSRITSAQNTANSAVTANNATLQFAQSTERRTQALESWRSSTADPQLRQRYKVIGNVFADNPGIQVGALNQAGVGISPRTHRFPVPMAQNPLILFSLYGDVNYPRFELINENGKITGFTLFHQPTAGLWMAVGVPA